MVKNYLNFIKSSFLSSINLIFDRYYSDVFNCKFKKRILILYKVDGCNTFFGYNDRSPLSFKGDLVLAHKTIDSSWTLDSPQSEIDIGYFYYPEGNRFFHICKSKAWSLQQGSMLQFLPESTNEVIFNDFNGLSYCTRVCTLDGKIIRNLPFAYYSISSDLSLITSLDFERLNYFRPGYGYKCNNYNNLSLTDPVAYKVVNYSDLSIYREVLYEELWCSAQTSSQCYINHLVFSPLNNYLAFFLIYEKTNKRNIVMFVHDLANDTFHKVQTEGTPSHFCWKNSNEFVVTVRNESLQWSTILYGISVGGDIVNKGVFKYLNFDSHPVISKRGELIIERAHLNFIGKTFLYVYDPQSKRAKHLFSLRLPTKFRGPLRSDLHHRLVVDEDKLHLDIVMDGVRCSAILSL
jgi:hypothetical protein